ncbi:MAG: hypothetical protein CTY18_06105 [Methylomonas sp.]|nr:MAG: hypothetical protein CTY18_06105 [Methylomonas sp.]
MTDILEKLKRECARTSITHVAQRIGVPRCTLSLVVSGKYGLSTQRPNGANPKRILAKFELIYSRIDCPHLKQSLTREICQVYAEKKRPNNPIRLQHWRACQNCPNKPTGDRI